MIPLLNTSGDEGLLNQSLLAHCCDSAVVFGDTSLKSLGFTSRVEVICRVFRKLQNFIRGYKTCAWSRRRRIIMRW